MKYLKFGSISENFLLVILLLCLQSWRKSIVFVFLAKFNLGENSNVFHAELSLCGCRMHYYLYQYDWNQIIAIDSPE